MRRGLIISALLVGLGLVAAPAVFQMFTRAPQGAEMINEFRPFMSQQRVDAFGGYLVEIDAADAESTALVRPAIESANLLGDDTWDEKFASVSTLEESWPAIQADMTDLIDRMNANLDSYAAVDALPSFDLFPWFFVIPGLLVIALATASLLLEQRGRSAQRYLLVLVVIGLSVSAAPVAFQMFTRAPKGGEMINDFRPMMTTERVRNVQGYFITMGAAEGQIRKATLPLYASLDPAEVVATPALDQFSADWPTIVSDFAPMISVMSDNVDNFEAVDSLPPFPLFPWFFVAPGLILALLAGAALRVEQHQAIKERVQS